MGVERRLAKKVHCDFLGAAVALSWRFRIGAGAAKGLLETVKGVIAKLQEGSAKVTPESIQRCRDH